MHTKIFTTLKLSFLALSLSFVSTSVYAWTVPTLTPPGGNVAAPINVSSVAQTKVGNFTAPNLIDISATAQTKAGTLTVGSLITAGDITGANRAAMTAVTTGVYDDATSNSPYSRINADSFHTNGLGVGQLFLEGNAIDANSPINIGKGLAGGMTAQAVNVGTINATGFSLSTGAAAGKVLTSDASGVATWQDAPAGVFHGTQTFYSNGTMLIPPGVTSLTITGCGGGGGGGGGSPSYNIYYPTAPVATGGGTGQCVTNTPYAFAGSGFTTLTITIGAGGAGGGGGSIVYGAGYAGGAGGSTVVSGVVTLAGGAGGAGQSMGYGPAAAWGLQAGAGGSNAYGTGGVGGWTVTNYGPQQGTGGNPGTGYGAGGGGGGGSAYWPGVNGWIFGGYGGSGTSGFVKISY